MDSPERDCFPIEDSCFDSLSPIDQVYKLAPYRQKFLETNFSSPPPVFKSPRLDAQRFLKREEIDGGRQDVRENSKMLPPMLYPFLKNEVQPSGSAANVQAHSQVQSMLIHCFQKEVKSCSSSGFVDQFLDDTLEVEDSQRSLQARPFKDSAHLQEVDYYQRSIHRHLQFGGTTVYKGDSSGSSHNQCNSLPGVVNSRLSDRLTMFPAIDSSSHVQAIDISESESVGLSQNDGSIQFPVSNLFETNDFVCCMPSEEKRKVECLGISESIDISESESVELSQNDGNIQFSVSNLLETNDFVCCMPSEEKREVESLGICSNISSPSLVAREADIREETHTVKTATSEVSNKESPQRKRKKDASDSEGCKRCNCKRTKCLKLYCDCFAAGVYCIDSCSCENCFNKPEYEETVNDTRKTIQSRNPLAFAPKIVESMTKSPADLAKNRNGTTPSSARHKRGCNCKKSKCLKKYCECYQARVGCSDGCRCEGCNNPFSLKTESTYRGSEIQEKQYHYRLDSKETKTDTIHKIPILHQNSESETSHVNPHSYLLWGGTPTSLTPELSEMSMFDELDNNVSELTRVDSIPTTSSVKVISPNKKRVSSSLNVLSEERSRSSLKSARRFILQSVPSFPSLTPCSSSSKSKDCFDQFEKDLDNSSSQ